MRRRVLLTAHGICSYFVHMPEPYWPKRKSSYLLSDAERHARHAAIWCRYCKQKRYFLLHELRAAFGNIECDDVVFQQKWRCTGCKTGASFEIKIEEPPAAGGVTVRRLARVEYIRRPIWRDERC